MQSLVCEFQVVLESYVYWFLYFLVGFNVIYEQALLSPDIQQVTRLFNPRRRNHPREAQVGTNLFFESRFHRLFDQTPRDVVAAGRCSRLGLGAIDRGAGQQHQRKHRPQWRAGHRDRQSQWQRPFP